MQFYKIAISFALLLNVVAALGLEIVLSSGDPALKPAQLIAVALLITAALCYYALTHLHEILGEPERK